MGRHFFHAVLTIVALNSATAQFQWDWLHPRPQGNAIRYLKAWDEQHWYAAGDAATFMKTTDGGATWTKRHDAAFPQLRTSTNQQNSIKSAWFFDQNTGILAGEGPGITRTTDAGATWDSIRILASTNGGSISDIQFLDASTGFLCGNAEYKAWKTTDGGLHWTPLPNVPSNTYSAVYALDENNIFLAIWDASGTVVHTSNGGATWHTIDTGVPNAVNDMVFTSATKGYVCGPLGGFAYSQNGGVTWTSVPMPVTSPMSKVWASDSEVFIIGDTRSVYRTTNDGATWHSLPFVDNDDSAFTWLKYSFEKINSTMIVSGSHGLMNKSTDNGGNWSPLSYNQSQANFWTVFARGSRDIWAAGDGLFYTKDGGNTWVVGTPGAAPRIYSIKMVNKDLGYYCGDGAALARTRDGGVTWTALTYPDQTKTLFDIDFINQEIGWVVGGTSIPATSTIAKTTDGGDTWIMQTLPFNNALVRDIVMLDANNGWCNAGSRACRTTNGGATWTLANAPPSAYINSLKPFDINTAIGVTQDGRIWKTTNGGTSWDTLPSPSPIGRALFATDWTDRMTGVIAGASGFTAKTTDGGQTWSSIYVGGNMTARGVVMIAPDTAFCVTGSGGLITGGQVFRYAGSSQSQLGLSGNYTVGVGGDFPTIDSAFQQLVQGVSGPVTFTLTDSVYGLAHHGMASVTTGSRDVVTSLIDARARRLSSPVSTTLPISLVGPIPGASESNRITIRPADNTHVTITSNSAATFSLQDVSYLTIDGIGTSGPTQLTVRNTGTNGAAVAFLGASRHNGVENLTIASDYSSGIGVYMDTASAAAPDSNLIVSNRISTSQYGIYLRGGDQSARANRFLENVIGDDSIGAVGIYHQQVSNGIIANNLIRNVKDVTATGSNLAGIWIATGERMRVNNNVVNGVTNRASATAPVFTAGVYSFGTAGDTSRSVFSNNMIHGIDNQSSNASSSVHGIYVQDCIQDTVAYNSVHLSGSDVASLLSGAISLGMNTSLLTIRNNIAINERVTAGAGRAIALYAGSAGINFSSDHNDLYVTTLANSYVGAVATTNYVTLADWQSTGRDSHSVNVMANFRAPDLHIDSSVTTPINGSGTPLPGLVSDIDGGLRNLIRPDIGADEFSTTTPVPPTINEIARNVRVPDAGDSVIVTGRIVDSSGDGIVDVSLMYSINGISPVSVPMMRTSGSNTDGMYEGKIPASAAVDGYRVEYRVMARGANNLVALTPVSPANSYFAGLSPLSLTGLKSMNPSRRLLYKGYYAKVGGTINGPNLQTTNLGYFLQDAIGGINLFKSGTTTPVLALGDSVIVTGKLDQFRGLTEIVPDTATIGSDIVLVATGRPVEATEITLAAFNTNPEFFEGRLLRMQGLLRRALTPVWPAAGSSANIVMYQSIVGDTIVTRIDSDTEIPGSTEPSYPVTITGIAGQFSSSSSINNDGYQIQPRYVTDLAPSQPSPGWSINTSGTSVTLYATKAVDQLVGWAAGQTFNANVTVLRTVNGGLTWTSVGRPPIGGAVYAIEAINANTAFVTTTPGSTSFIFRTTNGGTTWTQVHAQPGGFIDAIKMYDATTGIALGDPVNGKFTVLKTTDGGATWARMATEPSPTVSGEAGVNNSLSTYQQTHIWFGTSIGNIFRSTDGGLTWNHSFIGHQDKINELAFSGPLVGMCGLRAAYRTTNGGVTWSPSTGGVTQEDILGISAVGNNFWFSQGTNVYSSSDLGVTWSTSYSGGIGSLRHLDFVGSGPDARGWAVSATGGIAAAWFGSVTGVKEQTGKGIPTAFGLDQNYPNPFNPSTTIQFGLPKEAMVTLKVYNILGQEVAHLLSETKPAGHYELQWTAKNDAGGALPSGMYFYRLEAKPVAGDAQFVAFKKMLLLK